MFQAVVAVQMPAGSILLLRVPALALGFAGGFSPRKGEGLDAMAGQTQVPAAAAEAQFQQAWQALRGDGTVQFDLTPAAPPPQPPEWLRTLGHWIADLFRPLGRAVAWLTSQMPDAPYARVLLWAVLILAALALIWLLVQRWRSGDWRWPRWRRAELEAPVDEDWKPAEAPARAWLEEADALAARGQFAEAVHHLLRRSIDDIAWRRPQIVRPALTSRDIAATDGIPGQARALFKPIVAIVERSLFGGRAVSADEWSATRQTYAEFALPQAWRA
jgi:hypothetical protein